MPVAPILNTASPGWSAEAEKPNTEHLRKWSENARKPTRLHASPGVLNSRRASERGSAFSSQKP